MESGPPYHDWESGLSKTIRKISREYILMAAKIPIENWTDIIEEHVRGRMKNCYISYRALIKYTSMQIEFRISTHVLGKTISFIHLSESFDLNNMHERNFIVSMRGTKVFIQRRLCEKVFSAQSTNDDNDYKEYGI